MSDDYLGKDFSWTKVIIYGVGFLITMFIIGVSL